MSQTNWYSWESQEAFDNWHTQVIAELGLPRVGVNAATGQEQPEAQWTTSYTAVRKIENNDWRAPVESEIAERFAEGLGSPSFEFIEIDILDNEA